MQETTGDVNGIGRAILIQSQRDLEHRVHLGESFERNGALDLFSARFTVTIFCNSFLANTFAIARLVTASRQTVSAAVKIGKRIERGSSLSFG
ncbi:hypothetical protein [Rhodopirellula baltica]|uniref:hypothetical protein n=1 Tax=Rhodopirellula baltica TaxID=265606 RepID=UPI0011817FEB|nr:hypothetical protein [Rhodopirellula baltica]